MGFGGLSVTEALGASLKVENPCLPAESVVETVTPVVGWSVGQATQMVLDQKKVPYEGDASYFVSLFHTPQGLDAIVVLDSQRFLSFGWCYEVNGLQPAQLAGERILENSDQVRWFFGSLLYNNGNWSTQCVPLESPQRDHFCK